jgi:serine protease Do
MFGRCAGAVSSPSSKSKEFNMSALRRKSLALAAAAAIGGGAFFGAGLFRDAEFALASQRVDSARQQLSSIDEQSSAFRNIHEAVEPSVVNIRVTKTIAHESTPIPPEFQRFFHDFGGNMPPEAFNGNGGTMREVGTGSGVIMEAADGYGYILTNNHVAGGAGEMVVTLADGRVIKDATLVGADPKTDLAVVKIKADHLIPAKWGDSDQLEPGDRILAFGSPFGYVGSMTHGIVSALHRQAGILGADGYENFIQVDAPINPGNSGGPLVNLNGQVVGVNTAIASSSGGFQGIGFAIPSDEAKPVYEQLKNSGKVVRGWLGVSIENVAKATDEAQSEGYKGTNGVLVHSVLKNSPASSKLAPGDIVTSVDGKAVTDVSELRDRVAWSAPGTEMTLGVFHDGKTEDVKVKVGQIPRNPNEVASATPSAAHDNSDLGLQLGNVNDSQAQQFNPTEKSGAVVLQVNPNSPAAQAGLHEGDVITQINGQKITDAQQAEKMLAKADLKSGVRMQVSNEQGMELLFLKTDVG